MAVEIGIPYVLTAPDGGEIAQTVRGSSRMRPTSQVLPATATNGPGSVAPKE